MRTAGKLTAVVKKFLDVDAKLCGGVTQDGLVELGVAEQRPVALFGQGVGLDDLRGRCAAVLAGLPAITRGLVPANAPAPKIVRLRPSVS